LNVTCSKRSAISTPFMSKQRLLGPSMKDLKVFLESTDLARQRETSRVRALNFHYSRTQEQWKLIRRKLNLESIECLILKKQLSKRILLITSRLAS